MLNAKMISIITFGITLALLSFGGSSDAIVIEEMKPSYGAYQDHTGYLYHTAYVKTDEPYFMVDWYINGVYKSTSWGANDKTEAYFSPDTSYYPGTHTGTDYVIKAIAWAWVGGEEDTDNYTVTVYRSFHIVSLHFIYGSSEAYSFGGFIYHTARVKTSEPFFKVTWDVGGVIKRTSTGDGVKTEDYFSPQGLAGDIAGKTYTITASATLNVVDAQGNFVTDVKSYNLTVYTPIYTTAVEVGGNPKFSDVSGYAEISSHTYDPLSGVVSFGYKVSAFYRGNNERKQHNITTECKNTIFDLGQDGAKVEPGRDPSGTISKNNRSFSDSDSISNTLEKGVSGRKYRCEAYVRIIVHGALAREDHYHLTNTRWLPHP